MAFLPEVCCSPGVGCVYLDGRTGISTCTTNGGSVLRPADSPLGAFDYNEASSCMVGMNWDGVQKGPLAGNGLNPADRDILIQGWYPPTPAHLRGLRIYKSSRRASYHRGKLVYFEDTIFADNRDGPLWGFNAVLSDCVSVGWSRNAEIEYQFDTSGWRGATKLDRNPSGVLIYDGPLVLRNVLFAGLPSRKVLWRRPPPPSSRPTALAPPPTTPLPLPEQCDTSAEQQTSMCQAVCGCDCSAGNPLCGPVCRRPGGVLALPWCGEWTPKDTDITPRGVGTVGAADRFFGMNEGAVFSNPPYDRVKYGQRGDGEPVQSQAAVFFDVSGDLTNLPGSAIFSTRPINRKPGCVRPPGFSKSMACPATAPLAVSTIRFQQPGVDDAWMMRFLRTPVGVDPAIYHPHYDADADVPRLAMLQNGFAYHVMDWATHPADLEALQNANPGSSSRPTVRFLAARIGDVSPPIYLRHRAGCTEGPLRIGRATNGNGVTEGLLPVLDSEAALLASRQASVFYGTDFTALRLVASRSRGNLSEGAPLQAVSLQREVCCGGCGQTFVAGAVTTGAPMVSTERGSLFRGSVDVFSRNQATGIVTIAGFTCLAGSADPLRVVVTYPPGSTLVQDAGSTSGPTELDVLRVCGASTGARHRFNVTLSVSQLAAAGVADWQMLSVVGVVPGDSGWSTYIPFAEVEDPDALVLSSDAELHAFFFASGLVLYLFGPFPRSCHPP